MRTINKAGFDIIREFEGLRLKAYLCPAKVWTIGYGHTGKDVTPGQVITVERANELLAADLRKFERAVDEHAGTCTDNQFSALVSLCYNIGEGAFEESTLLRLHRDGQHGMVAMQFHRWNRGGGRVLQGLSRRRAAEAALYSKP